MDCVPHVLPATGMFLTSEENSLYELLLKPCGARLPVSNAGRRSLTAVDARTVLNVAAMQARTRTNAIRARRLMDCFLPSTPWYRARAGGITPRWRCLQRS